MIHYSFFGYMIASAIIMIVCVMAYRVLMENKVRPSTNRLILLLIYAITFLFPFLVSIIPEFNNEDRIVIGNLEFGGVMNSVNGDQEVFSFQLLMLLLWLSRVYFLGLFITFLFCVLTIGHLIFLLRKSKIMEIAGTEVYVHGNKKLSSFSWCNKIFLYENSLNSNPKVLQMLVYHEKAHLDKGHWMDLALAQIILIFQWFNPAAGFMRKELQRIHEYEADDSVLKSGIEEKDYQRLLIQNVLGSRYSGLTNGLNSSSLKKRIIMMKRKKFKKDRVTRGLAVCGFAILGGLIIRIPIVENVLETTLQSTKSNEKTIVIKGDGNEQIDEDVEYYVNCLKKQKNELASVDPSNIKEMTIDKSSEVTKVNITTKSESELSVKENNPQISDREKRSFEPDFEGTDNPHNL